MKKSSIILRSTAAAVGAAAVIFCLVGVVVDAFSGGVLRFEDYAFTRMAAGTLVIGLGFGIPAVVYEDDRIPAGIQTLIHMGIGCIVMTVTRYAVGWIPVEKGFLPVAVSLIGEIAVAFALWFFFYTDRKRMAKKMNERLAALNTENASGADHSAS